MSDENGNSRFVHPMDSRMLASSHWTALQQKNETCFYDMRKRIIQRKPPRLHHIDYRVNDIEDAKIAEKAAMCGLTKGDYSRRCALCHEPKLHLTDSEIEAYNQLADARGDMVHVRNALKGKTQEQIRCYFDDDDFMRQWVRAITRVIAQWDEILNKMRD